MKLQEHRKSVSKAMSAESENHLKMVNCDTKALYFMVVCKIKAVYHVDRRTRSGTTAAFSIGM